MSKPAAPGSAPPPLPTRRQLDELDALLQKMLDLPVQPVAEEAPADELTNTDDDPPPCSEEPLSPWARLDAQSAPADEPLPDQDSWPIDHPATDSPSVLFSSPYPAAPAPAIDATRWNDGGDPPQEINEETDPRDAMSPVETRRPGFLRLFLGWVGLFCLIAAVAILAFDWFGWPW
jgi:hypothetical protein